MTINPCGKKIKEDKNKEEKNTKILVLVCAFGMMLPLGAKAVLQPHSAVQWKLLLLKDLTFDEL